MAVASIRKRRIPTGFDDLEIEAKKIDSDRSRLTDHNGKLKFLKTSKYLQTLTQGEE